jgi:hypothetical protein
MGIINSEEKGGRSAGKPGVVSVRMSFESGEIGALSINFPRTVKVTGLRGQVVRQLGITAAGTITPSNSVGNMANGVLSWAGGTDLGNEDTATPTTNQLIAGGTNLTLTSAKGATEGGKVNVTVQYVEA